ncbi:MAG: phage integrase SAM-like domain-containing protein, partial [Psychroflexus maritimus]
MSTSNSIVSFYLLCRKTKSNPKFGLIYLRITVRKQITEFSLKRKIEFEHWNKDLQMSTQKGNQGREINYFLQQSKTKAYEIYNQLKNEGHFITPQLIKNYFLGKASDQKQLMKLIDYHQTKMKNVLAQGTLKNYFTTKNYLIEFLHEELKNSDIYLKQINYKFILDFEYFLRNKDSL